MYQFGLRRVLMAFLALLFTSSLVLPAKAADIQPAADSQPIIVDITADEMEVTGHCSLREAIQAEALFTAWIVPTTQAPVISAPTNHPI
jgi:CSLREA domain-containing protein